MYEYRKGKNFYRKKRPKRIVLTANADTGFMKNIQQAYEKEAYAGRLHTKNYFYLERGPYNISSVMDEGVNAASLKVTGPVIDITKSPSNTNNFNANIASIKTNMRIGKR
ncbi:MAG: hypothetical protein M3Z92_15130 [Bacteroidota bacterium]|nr:hypothetical protein [Bacteroidota bacterium]